MNVAVVGSGIAGLTAAHLLSRRHRVVLFEADRRLGGHTNTVQVEEGDRLLAVDTGFIVFNDRTYPNFIALMNSLGVQSRPSSMSFSVSCEHTGIEYNGASLVIVF
jgi:predicted NAD/FAD-binding protein